MTVWTDNAATFATRDRDRAANHILNHAVHEAARAYMVGHCLERNGIEGAAADLHGPVYKALLKAARKAERVLGAGS